MATDEYSGWYKPTPGGPRPLDIVEAAFEEAIRHFIEKKSNCHADVNRLNLIKPTTIQDVFQAVDGARQHYDRDMSQSKLKRCLEQVSERLHYYSNVMDVFVQHHPEYVSLAWGTMKILFGAIVEHKKIGSVIAIGLFEIADSLPRVKLASSLYPTESIQRLAATLYVYIIQFLMRALRWYEERPWKRALHSVTHPVELRYADILDGIRRATASLDAEAVSASQAEQRDMHTMLLSIQELVHNGNQTAANDQRQIYLLLQKLSSRMGDLEIDVRSGQLISQSERAHISQSISTISITQALHVFSSQCSIDHQASLETARYQRDRRKGKRAAPIWRSQCLQSWNQSPKSSLLILKVRLADRQSAQDFSASAIQQLIESKTPILWVIKTCDDTHGMIDILKSFINQAIVFVHNNNGTFPVGHAERLLRAQLEEDFLKVLGDIIKPLKLVYFIIHLEAIEPIYIPQLLCSLRELIQIMSNMGSLTVIRILVINWDPRFAQGESEVVSVPRLKAARITKGQKARLHRRPLSGS